MTFTVYKSQADRVATDFAAEVEKHRQALLAHRFSRPARLRRPAQPAIPEIPAVPPSPARGRFPGTLGHPGFPGIPAQPEDEGDPGVPRPTHDALVEACIRRVPQADGPDDFVADYEMVDDTPPPVVLTLRLKKDRLLNEVVSKEAEMTAQIWAMGKRRLDTIKATAVMQKDEADRTPEEIAYLADFTAKMKSLEAIQLRAAELMSDIEDLTDETIASFSSTL